MAEEMITTENLSLDLLKGVFDAAYMDYTMESDKEIRVQEACKVFVLPNLERKDRIRLYAIFGFSDGSRPQERLHCVNKINEEYIMVTACATDNGLLVFRYDLMLEGGLPKKALVHTLKRFAAIPHAAVQDHGGDIVL